MVKKFKKSNGYTTKDLLHFGLDHLASSLKLFEFGPRRYDSAGYLAHLGIELYLKAMMLHYKQEFIGEHDFDKIRNKKNMPNSFFELSDENKFSELRYPRSSDPVEISSEDKDKIQCLCDEIYSILPDALKNEFDEIDHNKKGGRVLMKKEL